MSDYRLVVTKNNGEQFQIDFRSADDGEDLEMMRAMRNGLQADGYLAGIEQRTTEWRRVT